MTVTTGGAGSASRLLAADSGYGMNIVIRGLDTETRKKSLCNEMVLSMNKTDLDFGFEVVHGLDVVLGDGDVGQERYGG